MTFKKGYTPWNKGKRLSEEHKRNLSESQKGNIPWNRGLKTGQIPWNKGKKLPPFSEEHKHRISVAQTGKNNPFYGRTHSDETKRKISSAQKGEKGNFYGKHHTEETKAKIRATRLKTDFPKRDTSIEIALQKNLIFVGFPMRSMFLFVVFASLILCFQN